MHKQALRILAFGNKRASLIKYILVFWVALALCNRQNGLGEATKTAKPVPPVYVLATNANFNLHQDTLYFGNQCFTGHTYALCTTGDTQFVKAYLNGLEEGTQNKWYPNGKLAEQRFYLGGKKEGQQKAWWPDGKLRFTYTAANDTYAGELKEWDRKGMLYRDFNYVNGQEEGSEKMWWPDGSIRANYVTHAGKRYGLLGMKLCVNPVDSGRNGNRETAIGKR